MAKKKDDSDVAEVEKVRVYKKGNDTMTSFCGEIVQVSETGREFFDLAPDLKAMVADNINLIWPEDK